jgi:hypothetical protein
MTVDEAWDVMHGCSKPQYSCPSFRSLAAWILETGVGLPDDCSVFDLTEDRDTDAGE